MSYDAKKGAQVVAYLASKAPNKTLNVVKALKLVYLADRASLERSNKPLLREERVCMNNGPVNSTTYDYIKGTQKSAEWSAYITPLCDNKISVCGDINEWDELSRANIECLDAVWEKFGAMDEWELVEWTHNSDNIPEWQDPEGSTIPITLERILESLGRKEAKEIAETIRSFEARDEMIARYKTA